MTTDTEKVDVTEYVENHVDQRTANAFHIYDVVNNAQALIDEYTDSNHFPREVRWEWVDAAGVDGLRELIEACQKVVAIDVRL